MFESLKKIRSIGTAAAVGAFAGAYALGNMTSRFLDDDVPVEDNLRFLARLHASLQMVDMLVIDMYEESISSGEIEAPSKKITKKFSSRFRRLWADDGIADNVGRAIVRNLDVEFH